MKYDTLFTTRKGILDEKVFTLYKGIKVVLKMVKKKYKVVDFCGAFHLKFKGK